jgi:hypothetical protein
MRSVTSVGEVVQRSAAPLVAASVVVAGTAVAIVPQHTVSILRLLVVTVLLAVAATVGVAVLGPGGRLAGGLHGSASPFERPSRRTGGQPDPPGLGVIRSSLREDSLPAGRPLSASAERRLGIVARSVLDRTGIDLRDPPQAAAVRAAVRPATWAVLAGLASSRPAADPHAPPTRHRRPRPADVAAAAEVVHTVLDDLDRLADRERDRDRNPRPGGDR